MSRPNVLFVMTDQQRADTIAALGNHHVHTPNLDRLVEGGVSFTNAYSQCPVCVPARYNVRTGCEPPRTNYLTNGGPADGGPEVRERCDQYLAEAMRERGYRTFGIGKFHTSPRYEELGYDVHLHSEETYGTREHRERDAYASFIAEEHPEYDHLELLHGERTEMYYMPQMSPLPAELTVENWAAERAIEEIERDGDRPFFGVVSFVGPHPPLAPPVPFNRLYDPDRLPSPIRGDPELDHLDEQLPWMNHLIWATDAGGEVDDLRARAVRARYYGEITYIDRCLGKLLDAVEARGDAANTLICFYSDHGDLLGDHHGWQKESFFEESARIPFLVSWPAELPAGERCDDLVCLTDLFGIATAAAGDPELRDGIDVLGAIRDGGKGRDHLVGYYREPGTRHFKTMVREGDWKYVFMANGGREQLFHLGDDPNELEQRLHHEPAVAERLHGRAVAALREHGRGEAIDGGRLRAFPYAERERSRIYQFAGSRGVEGFPEDPADVLEGFDLGPAE